VCENNLYAASTHVSQSLRVADVAERATGYGIPGRVVDGMDVLAVHRAAFEAVARARAGRGPTLLECKTYRFKGHSRGDPCGYRSAEELQAWQQRDPLISCRAWLTQEAGVTNSELEEIENGADAMIEAAGGFAVPSPVPPVPHV